jgi:hypothetical protein
VRKLTDAKIAFIHFPAKSALVLRDRCVRFFFQKERAVCVTARLSVFLRRACFF